MSSPSPLGIVNFLKQLTLDALSDSDQGINSGNLESISLELVLEGDNQFGEMESFSPDISIFNNGLDDVALDFTNSCRGEIWVVDLSGNVVMDSRSMKECSENEVEYQLQPDTSRSFSQPDWNIHGHVWLSYSLLEIYW